ncbi:MAG TPA: hypothetical protein VLB51_17455 [Methylomirabilota bacterium]|nr:hypothetical protein [Methylomirabilota bacterium]
MWTERLYALAERYLGIPAGLAIALHAPLTDLAGWAFLAVRRPFKD